MKLPIVPLDKANHFIYGALISGVAILVMPWLYAFIVTAVVGVAKEVYDHYSKKGTPDINDFLYTIAGSVPVLISHL